MAATGLIPHLTVKDAAKAIEFYVAALGAVEVMRMPAEDGRLMYACLKVGESELFLCDDFPEYCGGESSAPAAGQSTPVTIHLNVADADAAISRAALAGAEVTMPAEDAFWGDRYGRVRDPFGHQWSFATPLAQTAAKAA